MKKISGVPKGFVWAVVVVVVFSAFNFWLTREVEHIVGPQVAKKPAPAAIQIPAGPRIPVVDPKNDLLAPVAQVASPQDYLKRRPQKNTEERVYGIPKSDGLITQ